MANLAQTVASVAIVLTPRTEQPRHVGVRFTVHGFEPIRADAARATTMRVINELRPARKR